MKQQLVRSAIRLRFRLTGRRTADRQIRRLLDRYLLLAGAFGPDKGRRPIRVPAMLGVDENMREWSFFMILEHNSIVNRSITSIVNSLARDLEPTGLGAIDPKRDVMPSENPGQEQIAFFHESVADHLKMVAHLTGLRGTRAKRHPVFDELDAHGWHCMFGLHLEVHLKQACSLKRILDASYKP